MIFTEIGGFMSKLEVIMPQDYHTVSPYLIVKHAAMAIDFYKKVFGATELMRMTLPDEKIAFAEIKIGDSIVLLSDEFPETGARCPKAIGGSPVRIHMYVEDVDALTHALIAAGSKVVIPLQDQFYGDRSVTVEDPFGQLWSLATRKEHITRKEILRRFEAMMRQLPN